MDLDGLLSGRLIFREGEGMDGLVSSGSIPTEDALPEGKMSAFVEELLLVRDIRLMSGLDQSDHPLSKFAYPDAINLVGYVVRVLPKLPMAPTTSAPGN